MHKTVAGLETTTHVRHLYSFMWQRRGRMRVKSAVFTLCDWLVGSFDLR